MKIRDTRLWAVFIAIAFLLLWCASIGVTCAVPAQEPLAEPIQASPVPEIRLIGVLGWGLVGLGFIITFFCKFHNTGCASDVISNI